MKHTIVRIMAKILALVAIGTLLNMAAVAADEKACAANPEVRQLDYWLGNWTISNLGASGNSTARVNLSLDKCLFVESWSGKGGHIGQDMFAYSSDAKSWYGMFADNEGRVHIFTSGKVRAGSAEFDGPSRGENGEEVMNRVRLIQLAPDKLGQTWEKSTDHGASWKTVFRGEYSRSNP